MPDDNMPPVQHYVGPLGDEVTLPFTADPLQGVAGYTFRATFTPYGSGTPTTFAAQVNEATNTIAVTITVESGRLVIRRYSDGKHQTTVAIVDIDGKNPESPHTR